MTAARRASGTAAAEPGAAGRARTIFFGSGAFAVPILEAVATDPRLEVVLCVTAPDRPAGRSKVFTPTPIALSARELGLPLLQPARVRAPEPVGLIAALEPALGVLADFGQIIPKVLLELPRLGILGIHPSLLPRHRGATPIAATIVTGDATAGVSLYRMDEGIDTGPVLATTAWPLDGSETGPSLEAEAARRAAALLVATLAGVLDGSLPAVPQSASDAPPTRPLRREDGRLDPGRPALELARLVRAYAGWPGTFIETSAGRIVVGVAAVAPPQPGDAPGRVVRHDGGVAMTTAVGRLVLEAVQPAGGRPMTGAQFLRGRAGIVDAHVIATPEHGG